MGLKSKIIKPKRGRPVSQQALKRYNVTLDDQTHEGMKSLGSGNLSGGIRKAWQKIKGAP